MTLDPKLYFEDIFPPEPKPSGFPNIDVIAWEAGFIAMRHFAQTLTKEIKDLRDRLDYARDQGYILRRDRETALDEAVETNRKLKLSEANVKTLENTRAELQNELNTIHCIVSEPKAYVSWVESGTCNTVSVSAGYAPLLQARLDRLAAVEEAAINGAYPAPPSPNYPSGAAKSTARWTSEVVAWGFYHVNSAAFLRSCGKPSDSSDYVAAQHEIPSWVWKDSATGNLPLAAAVRFLVQKFAIHEGLSEPLSDTERKAYEASIADLKAVIKLHNESGNTPLPITHVFKSESGEVVGRLYGTGYDFVSIYRKGEDHGRQAKIEHVIKVFRDPTNGLEAVDWSTGIARGLSGEELRKVIAEGE